MSATMTRKRTLSDVDGMAEQAPMVYRMVGMYPGWQPHSEHKFHKTFTGHVDDRRPMATIPDREVWPPNPDKDLVWAPGGPHGAAILVPKHPWVAWEDVIPGLGALAHEDAAAATAAERPAKRPRGDHAADKATVGEILGLVLPAEWTKLTTEAAAAAAVRSTDAVAAQSKWAHEEEDETLAARVQAGRLAKVERDQRLAAKKATQDKAARDAAMKDKAAKKVGRVSY